jgi:putative transcriptional regulator
MWRTCLPVLLSLFLLFPWDGARVEAGFLAPVPITPKVLRTPAPGMLLVASRAVHDRYFTATVVFVLQHDEHGSLGIIINHPAQVRLGDWMPELDGTPQASMLLHYGGPVYPEYMTVLMENWKPEQREDDPDRVFHVTGKLYASFDPSVLKELQQAGADPQRRLRCYFGHLGWYAGQLEKEIQNHYWHLVPGDVDAVFGSETGSLWQRMIERLEPLDRVVPPGVSLRTQ